MSEQHERWEERLREQARAFPYPPTPDAAGAVRRHLAEEAAQRSRRRWSSHRLVWAGALLAIILVSLLSVPEVRARIGALLRIGAVEIVLATPTPGITATVPAPTTTATSEAPTPRPTLRASVLNLAGETSLPAAQNQVPFPIRLPTYPPNLGPPDNVFVQDLGGPAVIFVWLEPGSEDRVRLSLHALTSDVFAEKTLHEVTRLQETTVNGQPAAWVRGPHILQFYNRSGYPDYDARRLVDGNVLIWTEGEITYRLETDLPLEEAVRIAESLQEVES